jgi:hypothetical protein
MLRPCASDKTNKEAEHLLYKLYDVPGTATCPSPNDSLWT